MIMKTIFKLLSFFKLKHIPFHLRSEYLLLSENVTETSYISRSNGVFLFCDYDCSFVFRMSPELFDHFSFPYSFSHDEVDYYGLSPFLPFSSRMVAFDPFTGSCFLYTLNHCFSFSHVQFLRLKQKKLVHLISFSRAREVSNYVDSLDPEFFYYELNKYVL
jgi:hypothetical protein